MSEELVGEAVDRIVKAYAPKTVAELAAEVVDAVNGMTAEQGRASELAAGYGRPGDYRSYWD